ncbi:MAG: hypothetical protein HY558_01190, partial [Euryarchaeota archaeon]|nr:hypothetical protein [Euryarchaeota archaeon]
MLRPILPLLLALLLLSGPALGAVPWLNETWHYRLPVEVNASVSRRVDWPVEMQVNFTSYLESLPPAGNRTLNRTLDPDSIRVVEYNNTSQQPLSYNATGYPASDPRRYFVPAQFDPCNLLDPPYQCSAYNNTTNANGSVAWLMNGTSTNTTSRTYHIYFDVQANEYPPGTSPKEPMQFYTETRFNYTDAGDEFWVNTSLIRLQVDTDRGPGSEANLSGIYNVSDLTKTSSTDTVPGNVLGVGAASGERPVEYVKYYNGSNNTELSFDLRNSKTLLINGPVKKVVEQNGAEFFYGNASNRTNESNLTKRYTFYLDNRWVRISQNLTNNGTASIVRNFTTSGSSGQVCTGADIACPGPLHIDPRVDDEWGSSFILGASTTTDPFSMAGDSLVFDSDSNGCRIFLVVNAYDTGPFVSRRHGAAIRGGAGITLSPNTTLLSGESIFESAAVLFDRVAANAGFECLGDQGGFAVSELFRANFSSPIQTNTSALERWEVWASAEPNQTLFNRGEQANLTLNVSLDNFSLNRSANASLNVSGDRVSLSCQNCNTTPPWFWSGLATFGEANATGFWNATFNVSSASGYPAGALEGYILNNSSVSLNITDRYNATLDPQNANFTENGTPVYINNTRFWFHFTVKNARNDTSILGVTPANLTCRVNNTFTIPDANETEVGGGVYEVNNTTSSREPEYWNLSCGASRSGNTANLSLSFKTEPPGTNLTLDLRPDANTSSEINLTLNNTSLLNLTVRNAANGTAIRMNLTVSAGHAGWDIFNESGGSINGLVQNYPLNSGHLPAGAYFNLTYLNVSIPANASPGAYLVNVSVRWSHLNGSEAFAYDNTTITVPSNPWMNLTGVNLYGNSTPLNDSVQQPILLNLTTLEHGNTSFPLANFTLRSVGNDLLRYIQFQNLTVAGSNLEAGGLSVNFSNGTANATGSNITSGRNVTHYLNVTVPLGHPAGVFWGHYRINATGSACAAGQEHRCFKDLNITIEVPENRTWNLSHNISSIVTTNSSVTNQTAGHLTIQNTATLPIAFTIDDFQPTGTWVSNVSRNNTTFTLDPAATTIVRINYTVPALQSPADFPITVRVNSTTANTRNQASGNNSSNTTFTLRVFDTEPPVLSNVTIGGQTTPETIRNITLDVLQENVTLSLNVTDNLNVSQVNATINFTGPLLNGSFSNRDNVSLLEVAPGLYQALYTPPAINGTYTVAFTAFDNNTTRNQNTSTTLGVFTFNATNYTNATFGQNQTFDATQVGQTQGETFTLQALFTNNGSGGAYNVNFTATVNNSTALSLNTSTQTCGTVREGENCTRHFLLTAALGASNGSYTANISANWTQPNSTAAYANNTTLAQVWRNPLLNLSQGGASIEGQPVILQAAPGIQAATDVTVNSSGNHLLENVTWTNLSVNASHEGINITVNNSGFNLTAGPNATTRFNVTVPAGHTQGTWRFHYQASANNSTCITANRCAKEYFLDIFVAPSRNWTLNDSTEANLTCGQLDNRVAVSVPNASLCIIKVNNTGNSPLNFSVLPANLTLGGAGNTSANRTNFSIGVLGAPAYLNFTVNTTGVAPGAYNLTFNITSLQNGTGTNASPSIRNVTINITVVTEPRAAFLNATTPTAANFTLNGSNVTRVLQGENVTLFINSTDESGTANIGIREVRVNATRPDGTTFSVVSTNNTTPNNPNGDTTWRLLVVGTANFTIRGNYTVNISAVDNVGTSSANTTIYIVVRPKLNLTHNTSKTSYGAVTTSYGPNDKVFVNHFLTDLLGTPLSGANINLTVLDSTNSSAPCNPLAGGGQYATGSAGTPTSETSCKLALASSGAHLYISNITFNDTANNTTVNDAFQGSFQVTAPELFVSLTIGGPWKPGDSFPVEISVKDQNQNPTGDAQTRVHLFYPNDTLYNITNATYSSALELFRATLVLGADIPYGPTGSTNSTYHAKAVANKTGSNTTVNDTKLFYVTDTLSADMTLSTPQFNNTTMSASILTWRGSNTLVNPTYLEFNVSTAADAPAFSTLANSRVVITDPDFLSSTAPNNTTSGPFTITKQGTGYFNISRQIPSDQATGFYKANLTVQRGDVTAGDLVPFEVARSSLDVSVVATNSPVTTSTLQFTTTIRNLGPAGGRDVTLAYQVVQSPSTSGSLLCLVNAFSTSTCPGSLSVGGLASGAYTLQVTASGGGFETATATTSFTVGAGGTPGGGPGPLPTTTTSGGGGPPPPPAPPAAAKGGKLKLDLQDSLEVVRGYIVNFTFTLTNTGTDTLRDILVEHQGLPEGWAQVLPLGAIRPLAAGESQPYVLSFRVPPDAEAQTLTLRLRAAAGSITDSKSAQVRVFKEWSDILPERMVRVDDTIQQVRRSTDEAAKRGLNVTGVLPLLQEAEAYLAQAREAFLNRDYNTASLAMEQARALADRANALLGARLAAQPPPPIALVPLAIVLAVLGALAAAALGTAVWTGRTSHKLRRLARTGLMATREVVGYRARPPGEPPPYREPPPST